MSDQTFVTPLFVSSWSLWASEADVNSSVGITSTASGAWPTANLRIYVPFAIPWPYPVRRVFWANGSAVSSNMAFAIYSIDGTLIYTTGSVASAGASALQYVTPTEFTLYPGRYYMSLSCDATSVNRLYLATITTIDARLRGLLQQASAFTAPATMTGAQFTGTLFPLCGITQTASGF
jgi:hypothetical protein